MMTTDGHRIIRSEGLKAPLWYLQCYNRLLADCSRVSGCAIEAPLDYLSTSWPLYDGPALDRELLKAIEEFPLDGGTHLRSIKPPEWLIPLWVSASREIEEDGRGSCALRELRQLLLFGYKAEVEPNDEQIKEAQASFEASDLLCANTAEHLMGAMAVPYTGSLYEGVTRILDLARQAVSRVVCNIDWRQITPSHGPGAVFPSRKPALKAAFNVKYESIHRYYPFDEYFLSGFHALEDALTRGLVGSSDHIVEEHVVAKLVAVPKDSRGPRLICVHPAEAIWVQQGKRFVLEAAIERHPLTRGRINFNDQTVNQRLALASSFDQKYCTIDLKDASDLVSDVLVRILFGEYTYGWISCSRATKVRLIDGRVIMLHKWAPMGNCLTFPVESLVFWSVVRAGIYDTHGVICDDVYIVGDDIICPSEFFEGAIRGLTLVGLKVNKGKTFVKGFFRESCGVDAHRGQDVTPLRLKKSGIASVSEAISVCDLAKRARKRGYSELSAYLYSSISKRFGRLPLSNNPEAQGLFEYVDMTWMRLLIWEPSVRWDCKTQRLVSSVFQERSTLQQIANHDWCHVLDSLVMLLHRDSPASERGTEYPIPHRERLVSGWAQVI